MALLDIRQLTLPRPLIRLIAKKRRFAARHRLIAASPLIALAAVVGFGVQRHVASLDHQRQAWVDRVTVVAAKHPITAGSPITVDDIEMVELPVAAVAPSGLRQLPVDAVALDSLSTGEVLLANHLLDSATRRLLPGQRGVSIPVADSSLQVRVGDSVAVVDVEASRGATTSASIGGEARSAPQVIADTALVIDVSPTAAVIAVDESVAPAVARAAAGNQAVLILRPT